MRNMEGLFSGHLYRFASPAGPVILLRGGACRLSDWMVTLVVRLLPRLKIGNNLCNYFNHFLTGWDDGGHCSC